MTPATIAPVATRSHAAGRRSWREVQVGVMVGDLVLVVFMAGVTLALQGQFDWTPAILGAVAGGAWAALRRGSGRVGVIYAGTVSAALVALVIVSGRLAAFARPQSTFDLILTGAVVVTNVAGLIAGVCALRGLRGGRAAWAAPRVCGALIAALVVVGVAAGVSAYSASPLPGDAKIKAHQFEFDHTVVRLRAGRAAVFVQNDDPVHHDFTIKGVVSMPLPSEKARRAAFDIEPGTYRFYCSIHPDQMQGTVSVAR